MIRKVHKIDATQQAVGRVASEIAILLRGKNKTSYEPNLDQGDIVNVVNVDKLKFSGRKFEQKVYYRHTGYPGGVREEKLKSLFKRKPEEVLRKAVYNMLPKNKLRDQMIKRLRFIK